MTPLEIREEILRIAALEEDQQQEDLFLRFTIEYEHGELATDDYINAVKGFNFTTPELKDLISKIINS